MEFVIGKPKGRAISTAFCDKPCSAAASDCASAASIKPAPGAIRAAIRRSRTHRVGILVWTIVVVSTRGCASTLRAQVMPASLSRERSIRNCTNEQVSHRCDARQGEIWATGYSIPYSGSAAFSTDHAQIGIEFPRFPHSWFLRNSSGVGNLGGGTGSDGPRLDRSRCHFW